MGNLNERLKLVLDDKTTLAQGQATLCKLKLAKAPQFLKNGRQVCGIPVKDIRSGSSCASAGRFFTMTQTERIAVPLLNPSYKGMTLRAGQKMAHALPAMSEVFDLKEADGDCLNPECDSCKPGSESKALSP